MINWALVFIYGNTLQELHFQSIFPLIWAIAVVDIRVWVLLAEVLALTTGAKDRVNWYASLPNRWYLLWEPIWSSRDETYSLRNVVPVNETKSCFGPNLSDITTILMPLHSPYVAVLSKPNFTFVAWYLPKFAYLSMLFILQQTLTVTSAGLLRINNMKK